MNLTKLSVSFNFFSFFPNSTQFRNSSNLTSSQIEINVGTNEWWWGGKRYKVNDIIVHERYSRDGEKNDIALIRVQTPIKFNERVQPIKYTAKEVPHGTALQTTGWGRSHVSFLIVYVIFAVNLTSCLLIRSNTNTIGKWHNGRKATGYVR